ncbi:CopM family metallochaperone [Methylobacterium sp. DCY52]|uniref:CopM family metallochaperone n=1 Tax=Methylobacterium sp. DCY52 TaxID=739139 RepID=UPI003144EA30
MRGAPTAILITLLMAGGVLSGGMMMRAGHAETAPGGFDAMMAQSMAQMHADMAVTPSGDPDRDFAAMMIPHHQGAIEMAKAELAYGRDPVLRRLAQGIIVEQAQEIEVMRRALAERPVAQATPQRMPAHHHH